MLGALLLVVQGYDLAGLDQLAKSRDVAGIVSRLAPGQPEAIKHLAAIKTNGAYDTGRFGWKAEGDARNVVLTTALTSEDIGDYLFSVQNGKLRYLPETSTLGVRIKRHSLSASFDIDNKLAIISDVVQFKSTGQGPWNFRLSPAYRVESVETTMGVNVPFRQFGGVVLFDSRPGAEFSLNVRYVGKVNLPQYAGSISDKEISLTNDYWYPLIGRNPAPYDLTTQVPAEWTPVGQGVKVSESVDAGLKTTKFKMDLPVVYYSFAAGPYKSTAVKLGTKIYRAWSPRLTERQLDTTARMYAPIVNYFESAFGPFPFPGYGALDSPAYGGGALEAYSHATWGGGLPMEDTHETAHTYWGGMVNNSYLTDFWNESFAVFCEGLYSRNVAIGDPTSRKQAYVSDADPIPAYNEHPITNGGAYVGGVASSLGYGKGAKVLQMLEQIVGTQALIQTMRKWKDQQARTEVADWQAFRALAIARHPDRNLTRFFADWLDQPGWAKLALSNVRYANRTVSFDLTFNGKEFYLPVDVLLEYPGGRQVYTKLTVLKSGRYSIESAVKPDLVSVDPWNRSLRDRNANETPASIQSSYQRNRRVTDPRQDWFTEGWNPSSVNKIPADPAGHLIVGHPETLPGMAQLCAKVGFVVKGNKLQYGSRVVDLTAGGAMAVVTLENGKSCVIALGKVRCRPDAGRARLALLDDFGRMTFGVTDPKRSGNLTARL